MIRYILYAILTAVLYNLSFTPISFNFLAWICLVPFLYIVISLTSLKKTFYFSLLTGTLTYFPLIYWLKDVSFFAPIFVLIYIILFFTAFGILTNLTYRYAQKYFLLLVPVFWVVLELLRELTSFSLPWAFLAYTQYSFLPLLQFASVFGYYGIGLLLLFFNALVTLCLKKRVFLKTAFILFTAVFMLIYLWGVFRLSTTKLTPLGRVGFIQGNISQSAKWKLKNRIKTLEKYIFFTKLLSADKPSVIIWPETAAPFYLEYERDHKERIASLTKEFDVAVAAGAPSVQVYKIGNRYEERYFNTVFLFKNGRISGRYDKIHLVPFGEYVPFLKGFVEKAVTGIGDFSPGSNFTVFHVKNMKFSTPICFEELYSLLVKKFVANGAQFLAFVTNDAWYGYSNMPYLHNIAGAFRAAEYGVSVIRAANTGVSAFFDPLGRNLYVSDVFVEDAKNFIVDKPVGPTFYYKYGIYFIYLLTALAIAGIIIIIRTYTIKKTEE